MDLVGQLRQHLVEQVRLLLPNTWSQSPASLAQCGHGLDCGGLIGGAEVLGGLPGGGGLLAVMLPGVPLRRGGHDEEGHVDEHGRGGAVFAPAQDRPAVDEITPPSVRTWRAERLKATGATTVAKSYRLLKAILQTAVDDDLLRTNPCRIKGAGREEADERPTATVEQVFDLADAMGPRWRLMFLLGAFASLRPEELAELRRRSVDLDECSLRITHASPELTNGRRVTGDPKSRAGKRTVYLPDFLLPELRRHVQWFAEKEPDGLLFVGEKGAPFRRSTFGRKWCKARKKVGLPDNFRFYDLRHTGNTLAADTGAKLKDLMVRAGQSSERAQLIYQHSTVKHQRRLAQGIDSEVRERLREAGADRSEAM
ncbi:tyrosine-type recombinase/integrase [Streptomyces sp. NPDC057433]|uniref:tyrosine-type recombinase/integrase n=1 Tax=Streptomyces sp. NPDC057433 TaxID=3346132 RepID=UPI0036CFE3CC